MNRRTFLSALSCLPLVGPLFAKAAVPADVKVKASVGPRPWMSCDIDRPFVGSKCMMGRVARGFPGGVLVHSFHFGDVAATVHGKGGRTLPAGAGVACIFINDGDGGKWHVVASSHELVQGDASCDS